MYDSYKHRNGRRRKQRSTDLIENERLHNLKVGKVSNGQIWIKRERKTFHNPRLTAIHGETETSKEIRRTEDRISRKRRNRREANKSSF